MQATMNSATQPRMRAEDNKKFANDGSLESVEKLLIKLARRCFGRAQAMGLSMTFDDVLQEMHLSYVMAKQGWEPDRGVYFSTYLTTACYRNFNERIRRSEVERRNLGLVNFSDMRVVQVEGEDLDPLEFIDAQENSALYASNHYGDNIIQGFVSGEQSAPMNANPENFLSDVQESMLAREEALKRLENLTPNAKSVMADLLQAAKQRTDPEQRLPRMSDLLKKHGFSDSERRRLRHELAQAFGVKV